MEKPLDRGFQSHSRSADIRLVWNGFESIRAPASVRYWLYQHAWIVAGAKFGWWHGAQARQALAYVEERSK